MSSKLAVIILNYIDYEQTMLCVNDYLSQRNINMHLVVVDNDSPNDSYSKLSTVYASYDNVSVINSGYNGGYSYGNNFGLKFLYNIGYEGPLIISNNDVSFPNDTLISSWLNKHKSLENIGISAPIMLVGGKETDYSAWKSPSFFDDVKSTSIILEKLLGDSKKYSNEELCGTDPIVDCLPGSLFMVNMEHLVSVGYFDEGTFLYMEEVILSHKVKSLGLNNHLLTEYKYEHLYSNTISNVFNRLKMKRIAFESKVFYSLKYRKDSAFEVCLLCLSYLLGTALNYIYYSLKGK
ncbi:glycosyltransferase [Photobacterium ganghwense]|uniref:glycosyltransferase n=1 Tax=Photobacterium ganghwense TaxID=320778 RepID=UPI0040573598